MHLLKACDLGKCLVDKGQNWPAAGSVDTEIGCLRKPEASDAEAQV
jgi:hypothetical protein